MVLPDKNGIEMDKYHMKNGIKTVNYIGYLVLLFNHGMKMVKYGLKNGMKMENIIG